MFTERPDIGDVAAWWFLARSPSRRPPRFPTGPARRVLLGRAPKTSHPSAALERLAEELRHLFDGSCAEPGSPLAGAAGASHFPASEPDRSAPFRVAIPIAGLIPESLDLSIRDGTLVVRGLIDPEENAYRSSAVMRRIPLPDGLDVARAEANLVGGLLEVLIPRDGRHQAHPEPIPADRD